MAVQMRGYHRQIDFNRVADFLVAHYQPCNQDGNWLRATWDYMHTHPCLDETALDQIAVWEEAGEIVAVAHYESRLGEAFFELHPSYTGLKPEMLAYAEQALRGISAGERPFLRVYANDFDLEFISLVRARGYRRAPDCDRPISMFRLPDPFPEIRLPDGFRLQSLRDENDLRKINRVMWRGFNHPGEPPEDELPGRRKMQSGERFRTDLNIIAAAPDGSFAAYAGLWLDPINRIALVEPVATDPDYRRLGLGRAAVLEGIRRCGEEGATAAYVGSDQEFYRAIGFEKVYTSQCWLKFLDE